MLADERYPADLVVTKEDFLQSGWKDAISGSERCNHTIRCSALFDAERKALDNGQLSRGKVLSILKNACSWRELPEDVTEAEIAFFVEIVDEIDDPWLKAHLAHLVWHYQSSRNIPRNIKFALDAIDSYRSIPLNAENMVRANNFWDRAIGLALSMALLHEFYRVYPCRMLFFGQLLFSTLYDWGLPRWIMRLRMAQPKRLSTCWLPQLRAFSLSPMRCL